LAVVVQGRSGVLSLLVGVQERAVSLWKKNNYNNRNNSIDPKKDYPKMLWRLQSTHTPALDNLHFKFKPLISKLFV
jgi:hypothetical protein